jgi:predicted AAA+ superfamily ATPase
VIVRAAQKTVLTTLGRSRVVLLRSLPRSGRTSLIRALIHDMSDGSAKISGKNCADAKPHEIQASYAGRTVFVDAIDVDQVTAIDAVIRSCLESGRSAPRFLLTGRDTKTEQRLSAALMGIVTEVELPPIQILEHLSDSKQLLPPQSPMHEASPLPQSSNSPNWNKEILWLRGGPPDSLVADNDANSFTWRKSYLDSMLQQDLGCWNVDASDRLPEVLQWIANNNGEQFNDGNCAKNLSIKKESVRRSLNLLERMGLLRRLPNWPAGSNQSLNSMPVYYVRDSGLLHAMLGVETVKNLRESKAIGHSWESFCIEAIINAASENVTPAFYPDKEQNEIDLVLNFSTGATYAIEIKVNEAALAKKGFSIGCDAIGATHRIVVHAGERDITSINGIPRLTLISAIRSLPK